MKKRNLIVAVLCCVFALTLGLVGCGGGGGTSKSADPVAESKAAFTGSWDLSGMEENGQATSADDIATLKQYGLEVYLELNEDGSASLVLFGESMKGTWTPKTATSAEVKFEGETITMALADGTITMEQNGSKLMFTKGEKHSASSSASASASTAGTLSSSAAAASTAAPTVLRGTDYLKQDVSIDPITVADDDLVKIVAVAQAVDFEGDPGYIFEITNKSDIAVYVTNTDGVFTVNGQLIDPTLAETVAPGQTIEGIMFFDHTKLGSSDLSSLVAVEGTIEVWNDDTLATLGTYNFQA